MSGAGRRLPAALRTAARGLSLPALAFVAGCALAGEGGLSGPASTTTTAVSTTTAPTPTSAPPPSAPTTTTTPATTAPAPTTTTAPATTTTAPPEPPVGPTLARGEQGDAVVALQRRLRDLRFWVGEVDGVYGLLTEQAVFAFQRTNGLAVDGVVDPPTHRALDQPDIPVPQSTEGRVVEIDKGRQLLFAVLDGELQWVFHTSTGTEEPYQHPDGHTALADTPPGSHTVQWQVDGFRDGRLGRMYRPKYFHRDGIALHGYHSVPPRPASHGCARVTMAAIDFIWSSDLMPIGSTVLVYGEAPAPGPAV